MILLILQGLFNIKINIMGMVSHLKDTHFSSRVSLLLSRATILGSKISQLMVDQVEILIITMLCTITMPSLRTTPINPSLSKTENLMVTNTPRG